MEWPQWPVETRYQWVPGTLSSGSFATRAVGPRYLVPWVQGTVSNGFQVEDLPPLDFVQEVPGWLGLLPIHQPLNLVSDAALHLVGDLSYLSFIFVAPGCIYLSFYQSFIFVCDLCCLPRPHECQSCHGASWTAERGPGLKDYKSMIGINVLAVEIALYRTNILMSTEEPGSFDFEQHVI